MENSDIHSTFFLGATAHLTNSTIIKITWKNDKTVWTEQWPLMKEKLQAAKKLIDTQLELKHIEESCSPWNSPIFVIKKKSNKWHLQHSCLENPMDRGAWWASVYGVAQRWTRLTRLSSSSNRP